MTRVVPQAQLDADALKAYEYAYPLVYQSLAEKVQTDVAKPDGADSLAPVNELFNNPLAPLNNNTGPNADTLYTGGWLDLSKGPIVLHVPDFHGRFYSFEVGDAWTNTFAVIGRRTTGTAAADYAIVGPGFRGALPAGVKEIKSPTDLVDVLARTLVYGPSDQATADALRKQFTLTPLADYGKAYTPPTNVPIDPTVDAKTPIARQVATLSGTEFFKLAAELLKTNPPLPGDGQAVGWLEELGLTPGRDFVASALSPEQSAALAGVVGAGQTRIAADAYAFERSGPVVGGWIGLPADLEQFGTNYADRAGAAYTGVFTLANPRSEAIYLSAYTDAVGHPLDGNNNYVLTFKKGQFPPSSDFWSVTLYQGNAELYPNPRHKYAIGNRSDYQLNPDGSLSIYVGNRSPGAGKESNWLPAPPGAFDLTIRLYGPQPSALDGTWQPPAIVRLA